MTNVEALKALYVALGGTAADVADAATIVEVLNAIAAKYEGEDDATLNPEAIANIAAVADNIAPEPTLQNKTVTPTTEQQTVTADTGKDGLGTVTVEAVTAAIDSNITAGNIKKDVQILGVTGDYDPQPTLTTKSITANGTYAASSDNADGYSSVTVEVTSENNAKFVASPTEFTVATNLTSVDIPDGVASITNDAFKGCASLTSVNIPSSVTTIWPSAFENCGILPSIEIPSSVTTIYTNAFLGCSNLATITIHKAEGSITGAPWGATNATVVWDG